MVTMVVSVMSFPPVTMVVSASISVVNFPPFVENLRNASSGQSIRPELRVAHHLAIDIAKGTGQMTSNLVASAAWSRWDWCCCCSKLEESLSRHLRTIAAHWIASR